MISANEITRSHVCVFFGVSGVSGVSGGESSSRALDDRRAISISFDSNLNVSEVHRSGRIEERKRMKKVERGEERKKKKIMLMKGGGLRHQ